MGTTCKRPQGRSLRALTMTLVLALLAALLLAGTALAATPGKPTAKAPRGTITQAKPTFTWGKARGAAKYELRVYKGSKLLLKKAGISKRSWKSSKVLPKNVSLTWKVRAKNARGPGAWSKRPRFKVVTTPRSAKAITAFSFSSPAATGVINETLHTITLTVLFGTDVSALVPTITITGVSVNPASGVTNNFTSPRAYTVTAADHSTQAYVVTVAVAANWAKAITAFSFATPAATGVINETLHTIALTVPFGTDVSALVPTITITGASVSPASGVANDFSSQRTFTVTAADGTTQAYVVTVTVSASPATKYLVTSSTYSPVAGANVTISAQLADAYNNPVGTPGTTVTWTKSNGNGSFAAATSTTSASGIATVEFTTNTTSGTANTVTGTSPGPLTGTSFSITTTAGAATKIAVNAGAGQSAVAGTAVATPPSVIVKDAHDNVVSGVSITFVVATGGGFGTGLAATTDAGGIATVGSWTLGTTAGANTLAATSAGLTDSPLTFTATGTAGAATKYLVTSSSYSPVAGATVTISAQLADASGNAVSTADNLVTWTKSNANGSFATATSTTNASGLATVACTTHTVAGTVTTVTGATGALTGTSAVITTTLAIGDSYQGGKVAYFFVPGDTGYVAGQLHGLIVAASNQSDNTGMAWSNIDTTLVGTHPELGTGQANTTAIVGQAGCTSGAAYTCHYLIVSGVYDDWYLPSKDELNKVYLNKDAIGGIEPGSYWTSSEFNAVSAYTQFLGSGGNTGPAYKYIMREVRAVRTF